MIQKRKQEKDAAATRDKRQETARRWRFVAERERWSKKCLRMTVARSLGCGREEVDEAHETAAERLETAKPIRALFETS